MAWIESHQEIEDHPKTLDLMGLMSWDLDQTIGKIHRFWWWCLKYAEDGDLRKHNDDRLARAVALNGGDEAKRFVEAMVKACWLDRSPYFRVHDWWQYAGRLLQTRYKQNPQKWQKIRALYDGKQKNYTKNPPNNPPNNTIPTNQPDQPTRPTKRDVQTGPPRKFAKPQPEEVTAYALGLGYPLDGRKFCDYYESKGWVVGRAPMKCWQAAVRTWKRNGYGGENGKNAGAGAPVAGKYEHLSG